MQGDLEKDEDIKALLEATIKQFGKLDILVRSLNSMELSFLKNKPLYQLSDLHLLSLNTGQQCWYYSQRNY